MRNTRKIFVALLVVVTLLMSMTIVASAVKTTADTTLYLTPNTNWKTDNARYAVYTWDGGDQWFDMKDSNGDGVYEVTIPAGIENIIFCRMNPSTTANNWNNKWNQTSDLKYDGNNNHYTVSEGAWDKGAGTWTYFEAGECVHAPSGEGTIVTPATCTENGEISHTCSKCGKTYEAAILATGHAYAANGDCANCDVVAMLTIAGDSADLLGTTWDPSNTANKLSYNESGLWTISYTNDTNAEIWLEYKVCLDGAWTKCWGASAAGQTDADNAWVGIPAGHTLTISFDLGNEKITTATVAPHVHSWSDATCTEAQKCDCGETQGEALGHDYVDGACSRCGAAAPCEHVFEENTFYHPELVAATCCTPGVAVFECTLCDYYYTEAAPIDSEAHAFWGEQTIINAADCTTKTNGLMKVACDNGCGQFNEVEIDYSEAHNWDIQKNVEATCTEDGGYYAVCTLCSEVEEYSSEAQGHYNWYLNCGETGACMACGVEFTKNHEGDPATCTDAMYCYNCWSSVGDPLGHDFVDGVCSRCEEKDPDYVPVVNDNVIDFSKFEEYPKGTYADGDEQKYNDIFTFYHGKDSRVDPSSKTFEDGFEGTLRFGFGGKWKKVDGAPGRALQINAPSAGTITLWWVSGGAGRSVDLLDAEYNVIATTGTDEIADGGLYITTFEISEAGVYYLTNMVNNNYWFKVEYTPAQAEEPETPHVNSLVVGDTNKIVVNGETLNDAKLPIEWVAFVADEKAHYEFIGDNGALVFIFDANFNLLCGGTGKADLEAGTYLICIGNGLVGEINVAVTKTAIPVEEKWTFWISDGAPYTVDGYNFKYNGAGNTYGCIGTADVAPLAAGNNTFTVTITNNGTADSRVRVDIQGTTQVGNHKVCNVSAVGGDVWTDMEWGGSIVTVPAGESVTLVITYDAEGQYGAVTNLIFFVDAMRGDDAVYSSDITVSDMAFSNVSDEPVEPAHKNALVLGDNKFVVTDEILAGYIEYIVFVAAADGKYTFTASEGSNFVFFAYTDAWTESWVYTDPYVTNNGTTDNFVSVNLKAGLYIVGVNYFYGGTVAGEYNVNVTVGDYEEGGNVVVEKNKVVLGDNTYALTESLLGIGFEFTTFTADKDGYYTFAGQAPLTFFIWPDYPNTAVGDIPTTAPYDWNVKADNSGFEESFTVYLTAGVYAVGFRYDFAAVGDYTYSISYMEELPHEHSYEAVVTAPTCTDAGFTTYTCSCGDSYVGDAVVGLGHDYVDGACSRCEAKDPNYVPPHEHNFVEGKCECGAEDPDYVAPDEPQQPAPELTLVQKIMKAINDLMDKIGAWFKNLVAGFIKK